MPKRIEKCFLWLKIKSSKIDFTNKNIRHTFSYILWRTINNLKNKKEQLISAAKLKVGDDGEETIEVENGHLDSLIPDDAGSKFFVIIL